MSLKDFELSTDGDLIISESDLSVVEDTGFYIQLASNRIKSISKDWFKDNIGSDLEEVLGMPNTQDNAKIGEDKIRQALIFDNTFTEENVRIKSYPTSKNSIGFEVSITKHPFGSFFLRVSLDLVKGIMIGV